MEPNKTTLSTGWIIGAIVVVGIIVGIYFATRTATKNTDLDTETPMSLNDANPSGVLPAGRIAVTTYPKDLVVITTGSFPSKVQASISVDLPNNCSSVTGSTSQSGKIVTITTTASQPKDAVCAQVITPQTLTIDIPVAGLSAGTYTVNYETLSKTFTLAQSNTVEYSGDK